MSSGTYWAYVGAGFMLLMADFGLPRSTWPPPFGWAIFWCVAGLGFVFGFPVVFDLVRSLRPGIPRVLCPLIFTVALITPIVHFFHAGRAEFYRYPVALRAPAGTDAGFSQGTVSLVLVSDTHVTDRRTTLEGREPGTGNLESTLRRLAGAGAVMCVITGDLTDRGDPNEWELLAAVLRRTVGAPERPRPTVLLVPGNHDLQGPPEGDRDNPCPPSIGFDVPRIAFVRRAHQFYRLARVWQGSLKSTTGEELTNSDFGGLAARVDRDARQVKCVPVPTGSPIPPPVVPVYPEGFSELLDEATTEFDALFPLIYEDTTAGLVIMLLNSSAKVQPGTSMGLGDFGSPQLDRLTDSLQSLQRERSLKHLIVVTHHAPVRRETDRWEFRQALSRPPGATDVFAHTFLALDVSDARRLIAMLEEFADSRRDVNVMLAHGHRHGKFFGKTERGVGIVEIPALVESPSVGEPGSGAWAVYLMQDTLRARWADLGLPRW